MNKIKLIALLSLLTTCVFAENTQSNTELPIDLTADSGSYDQIAGIAVYEGNVKIKQGSAVIVADKVTIHLNNGAAEKIVSEGKPALFDYVGEKQPIHAEAYHTVYTIASKKIILTDKAVIKQGDDVIRGAKLSYDLQKEVIDGKRISITFKPMK